MSDLNFTAGIDRTQWKSDIDAIRRDLLGLNSTVQSETQKMDSSFRNLSLGIAGYFSASVLKGFTMELINVRGEFQKTEIAFTTMLGNADKAKELMGQMVDLAAKTPFSLQDVSNGAKQLLAFQVPANEVVDTLTRMGNIAAGLGVPLSRINLVYGQVKAKGKLAGDDLRQFTEAGIPMVAELAKKFNTSTSAISEMVSAGKIGFKDVQDVLFSLTDKGGMFFNLMEKQSVSLSGKISNLGDSWDQMLNKIGESNEGVLAGGIDGLNTLVEHYEDILDILTVLIATYGAYRAALIATVAIQNASTIAGNIQAFFQLASSIRSAKDAQILFNTVTKANPYVIAATALAALGTALYVYSNHLSDAEKAQQELNEEITRQQAPLVNTKTKIDSLVSAIKSENSTNAQRADWLKQIKTLSNGRLDQLTVEQIRTGKATSAINDYIKQLYKEAEAKAYLQRITDLSDKREQLRSKTKTGLSAGDLWDDMTDLTTSHQGTTKERRNRRLINEINFTSGEIQKARNKFNQITKEGLNTSDIIKESSITDTEKKSNKLKKEVEKIFPENTLKGLQQRIDKYRDIMEKSVINSNTYNSAKSKMEGYQKQLDDLTKQLQKKSFDEQLAENERQWNIRYQIAKQYGEDIAKAQFPNLKGDSYFDELNKQFKPLDDQYKSGATLSDADLKKWETLKKIIDSLNGVKDPFTNFTDGLDEEMSKLSTYAEKMEFLNKQLYSPEIMSGEGIDNKHKAEIIKRQEDLKKSWQQTYQSILEEQKTYEEKSAELAKQYAEIKNSYEYKNGSDADRKKIDDSFSKKATDLFLENLQNSDSWLRMFSEMETVTTTELENFKALLVKKLKEAKTEAEKIKIGGFIRQIDDELRGRNPFDSLYKSFSKLVQKIKDGTATAGDFIAVLKDLSGVKSEVNSLVDSFQAVSDALGLNIDTSGLKDTLNNIIGGVEGIGQAVSGFISGNPLDMVKGVMKAVSSIGQLFNGDKKKERSIKKQAAQLKILETAYNNLAYAAEKAFGSQKYSAQTDVIKNLEQQKQALQGMINTESSKKKADKGKIAEWQSQIQSINQSIDQIKTKIVEDVLQTSVVDAASKVGDALVDAFGRGESAVDSLNNAANDMIKNLLKNQLNLMLQKKMDPILQQLFVATGMNADGSGSFNGLTPEEIASFKAQVQAAGADMQGFLEAYSDIFGGLDANASSLEGAIKGVSEETASLIAGQMNAIRIVQAQMLENSNISIDVLRNSLLQLTQIEINTRFLRLIYLEVSKNNNDGSIRANGLI